MFYSSAYAVYLILIPGQLFSDHLYRKCSSSKKNCSGFNEIGKMVIQLTLYLFANACTVLLWRGVWYTCDIYILPDDQVTVI